MRRETTAGGAARIAAQLKRVKPSVVVIALGANDGLRGLPLAQTKANLDRMIVASKAAGARVLLVGMRIPPNYGRDYTQGFEANYAAINRYHLLGLATHFMATRDAENGGEGDSELDFDYQARVSRGQGKDSNNDMPGAAPKGDGPLIFVGNI